MFAAASVHEPAELKLTEGEINEIRSLSEICIYLPAIAILMKLPLPALIHCIKSDERVKEAIYAGRANAEKSIAAVLFKSAMGGNVAAGIWIEKTSFGRCEPPRMISSADEVKELSAS